MVDDDVKQRMHNELVRQIQAKASREGIDMKTKKGLRLDNINVHAESSLLTYHIRHPPKLIHTGTLVVQSFLVTPAVFCLGAIMVLQIL